ncbi:LysM peptidoglycan-binding domain-containing protein [Cellulomonas sp. Y8]|uniref:LysM peptidoglycan-binding domain-containing protein n=1 Tax=Cellulomonas sp. Y8 TaxID=2591145 RepID=UPI003D734AA7
MSQPALALTDQAARALGAPARAAGRRGRRLATSTGALAIAAVAATAAAPAAHADEQYTVRSGDTVSHIAAKYGTSVTAVRSANGLNGSAFIREGQRLTIPTAGGGAATTAATPASAGGAHTVASGETVSAIAKRYGTTVAAITSANGLDSRAFIRVGQTLTIPGAAAATASGAAAAAAPAATGGAHTVASGETVSAIAKRYGTTVAAVVSANGLDSRAFIRVGQPLTIPGASGAATTTAATAHTSAGGRHTVASGETVSAIAKRYGTTVAAITSANGLDSRAFIRVGQTLTIPGGSGAAAAAAPAATGSAQLVGNTFLGRTYAPTVVASANANKAALIAMGVPSKAAMQAKVAATARSMGVDPALAQAIAFQESGFNHTSVSPANAIGTMQVIPSSGEWASQLVGRDLNLLDPDDNVVAGVAIIRQLVRTSPDLSTAVASYYQGASSVKRNGMFSDTRRYVANVQTHMARY